MASSARALAALAVMLAVLLALAASQPERFAIVNSASTLNIGSSSEAIQGIAYVSYNRVLFATSGNNIYSATADGASLVLFAGNGVATSSPSGILASSASVNSPKGGAVAGGSYYFVEGHCARQVVLSTLIMTTIAGQCATQGLSGDGGSPIAAQLHNPSSIAVDNTGRVFIADTGNKRIRMISADRVVITTLADFTTENLDINSVSWDAETSYLYWSATSGVTGRVSLPGGQVTVLPPVTGALSVNAVPGLPHAVVYLTSTGNLEARDYLNAYTTSALSQTQSVSGTLRSLAAAPGLLLVGRADGSVRRFRRSGTPLAKFLTTVENPIGLRGFFDPTVVPPTTTVFPVLFASFPCGLGIADTGAYTAGPDCTNLGRFSKLVIRRDFAMITASATRHCVVQLGGGGGISATYFGTCGTSGSSASLLDSPTSVAVSPTTNDYLIADNGNRRIIRPGVTTYATTDYDIRDIVMESDTLVWFVGRKISTGSAVLSRLDTAANAIIDVIAVTPSRNTLVSGLLSQLVLEDPLSIDVVHNQHHTTLLVVDRFVGVIKIVLDISGTAGHFNMFVGMPGATWGALVTGTGRPEFLSVTSHTSGVSVGEASNNVILLPAIRATGVTGYQRLENNPATIPRWGSITIDSSNANIFAADQANGGVYMLENRQFPEKRVVQPATASQPSSLVMHNGDVLIVDRARHCVHRYNPGTQTTTTAVGLCDTASTSMTLGDGGRPIDARLSSPTVIKALPGSPNRFALIDQSGKRIRVIDFSVPIISTAHTVTSQTLRDITYSTTHSTFLFIAYTGSPGNTMLGYFDTMGAVQTIRSTGQSNIHQFPALATSNTALSSYQFSFGGPLEWQSGTSFRLFDGNKYLELTIPASFMGSTYRSLTKTVIFWQDALYGGLVDHRRGLEVINDWPSQTSETNVFSTHTNNFVSDGYASYVATTRELLAFDPNPFKCSHAATPTCTAGDCHVILGGDPLVRAETARATRVAGTQIVVDTFDGKASSELYFTNSASATFTYSGPPELSIQAESPPATSNCRRLKLLFAPRCYGTFTGSITIAYTSKLAGGMADTVTYPVKGVARAPVHRVFNNAFGSFPLSSDAAPSTIFGTDLGTVAAGASVTLTLVNRNLGDRRLTVRQPVLTQSGPGTPFSLSGTTSNLTPIDDLTTNPAAQQSFDVTFAAPTACGVYTASITIPSDDCTGRQVVNLQATVTSTAAPALSGCTNPPTTPALTDRCFAVIPLSVTATFCNQPYPVVGPTPPAPNNAFPVGTNTYSFQSTSPSGVVSAPCSITVTVTDTQQPKIQCPPTILVSSCFSTVRYLPPVASDNCGATVTQTAGLASGAIFPVGTTTNSFTATDAAGNTASCSFQVIVTAATCTESTLNPNVDHDGDGVTAADGDCCESTDQCRDPFTVNPGAAEIAGNGIDDNCNGQVDENRNCDRLLSEQRFQSLTINDIESFPRALGLCERVDDDSDRSSGYIFYSPLHPRITLADGFLGTKPNPLQLALLRSFGAITAVDGHGIVLSTGAARLNGELGKTGVDMDMGSVSDPPPAWPTAPTSIQLPFAPGCGLIQNRAFDSVRFRLNLRMPTNYRGFAVRFLFGAQQPDGRYPPTNLCQAQKDFFLILTNAKSAPAGGNIAVDSNREYISTLNPDPLFWSRCRQYSSLGACNEGPFSLTNTGYEGASRWQTVGANVVPGKVTNIDFVLFDGGDALRDSFVFIDQVFYIVEESTSPLYGPRWYSDVTMSSLRAPSAVLTTSGSPTATLQYSIRNQGPEPAADLFVSFTPPRGSRFVSITIDQTLLRCSTQGQGASTMQKCAVPQSLQARGTLSGQLVLGVQQGFHGSLVVRMTVSSSSIDRDLGNNARTATINARP